MLLFPTLPLRQKLPLVVAGLTTGALLVGAGLAYLEVRRAAVTAAEARLSSIVSELENLTTANQVQRDAVERRVVESPLVRAAIEGRALDTTALVELVGELRAEIDVGLPVIVLRADGSPALATGSLAGDPDGEPPRDVERAYGPLRSVGGRTLYWVSLPVPGPTSEPAGWVAHRRQLGSPATGSTFALLLGSDIRVLLGTLTDSTWADVSGSTVTLPPDAIQMGEPYRSTLPDGSETLAVARALGQPPWIVQVAMPLDAVMARPDAFRNSALAFVSLLSLLTVFLGWRAGRSLAEPLEGLASATEAMASGRYGGRVEVVGDDEVAHLAHAFNAMASHVERSEEALRLQLQEARTLAVRLEEAMLAADRAREEAQRASRAKSDFLATLSHEIRTPISAVITYIDLLARGVPDEPTDQQRQYLQRIEGANEHLISLVNDLLDFARMEAGEVRVDMDVASAAETVSEALATLEPTAARKDVRLESACGDSLRFFGDRQRVRQIVLNLVSNAIKFTPGGGSVVVRGRWSETGPPSVDRPPCPMWARIDVVDDGIGIEPDQVARMFEPFVQGQVQSRAETGTGLGLAISRRLASLMGGALTAESTPGAGSTFTLWLPSAPPAARTAEQGPPRSRPGSRRPSPAET